MLYKLTQPTLVERLTIASDTNKPVPDQRWLLAMKVDMQVRLQATGAGTLVKVRCWRQSTDSQSAQLRGVEVSEVADDR